MRRLGILLIFGFLVATLFSSTSLDRQVAVQVSLERPLAEAGNQSLALSLPLARPVVLNLDKAEHLRLVVQGYGADHVGVLNLELTGGAIELVTDGSVRGKRPSCAPDQKPGCSMPVRIAGEDPLSMRLVPKTGQIAIHQLAFDPVTSKRHGAASGSQIFFGFLALLLAGPVLVWLRRWPGADQYALVLGGLAWIFHASTIGFLVSVAFVLVGYYVILGVARLEARRARAVVTAVAGVAMLVLLLKFAAPAIAGAFANPGGFWLAVPLGISYLAIRIVDLLLAAYARTLRDFNLRDYLAFVLSPHTLPAGPIQLYGDFLRSRIVPYSMVDFSAGAARMLVGLGKKLLADSLLLPHVTRQMDTFLAGGAEMHGAAVAMLLGNLLYIYLDFSAYCDLAIGAARAGGRRLPENFDWPLVRNSVRAYWRHWHMTLSQWVMRRVYFPAFLASHSATLSLMASMLVIGLWHAPSICWALWALHHSLMMAAEGKLFPDSRGKQPVAQSPRPGCVKALRHLAGMAYLLAWVSLGHSFTLFADPQTATLCYITALGAPLRLIGGL